jgi:hypothetical protein
MNAPGDDLMTVAISQNATEANLIKNQLEAAGIKAFLSGEEAAAMAWHMSGAFGGIKVQVPASAAEDALSILERKAWQVESEKEKASVATAKTLAKMDDDEEPAEILSDREKAANQAARAAVFGLIFWPLEIYAIGLLLWVYFGPGKLEGRPRTNAKLASWIILPLLLFLCLVVVAIVYGPPQPGLSLRKLGHPDVMIGTWEGSFASERGEIRLAMTLESTGKIHYKETGAADTECTGTLGLRQSCVLVCYDRYLKGDSPQKGQLTRYDVERFRDGEMVLRFGNDTVRMARLK